MLGAAGVFSVAIGFAAQTSAANIISGLFVISERSFLIGDIIQVGNHTGEVLSVDMLSVKLRTFDNRYVRIPNETLIKTDVINLSKFQIRRSDLKTSIAYNSEYCAGARVLQQMATDNPLCLESRARKLYFRASANRQWIFSYRCGRRAKITVTCATACMKKLNWPSIQRRSHSISDAHGSFRQ